MAKFCKYCGTQLEDGQVCSCPQAQAELAAPAAAPAPEAAAPVATAAPAAAPSAGKDLLNKVKETFLSYLKAPKATTAKIAADPKGMTLAGIFAGVNALAVFLYLWKILGGIMGMAGDISGGLTDKIDIEYPIFQMLIAGIVIIAAGAAALLFSALQRYGYYHLLDGEADTYVRLHRRMIIFSIIGIALAVIGAGCLIVRTKM